MCQVRLMACAPALVIPSTPPKQDRQSKPKLVAGTMLCGWDGAQPKHGTAEHVR
jgi:hypothetical protein